MRRTPPVRAGPGRSATSTGRARPAAAPSRSPSDGRREWLGSGGQGVGGVRGTGGLQHTDRCRHASAPGSWRDTMTIDRDTGSIAQLLGRMDGLVAELEAEASPGRFFLATFTRTTRAVADALEDGWFEDPAWVEEWDVVFADLYL